MFFHAIRKTIRWFTTTNRRSLGRDGAVMEDVGLLSGQPSHALGRRSQIPALRPMRSSWTPRSADRPRLVATRYNLRRDLPLIDASLQ